MKYFKNHSSILLVALIALLVTACGGGGSSDDGDDVPDTTTGVSITTSNAESIAAKVMSSFDTVEGSSISTDMITGVSISHSESNVGYADLIVWQLEQQFALVNQSSSNNVIGVVINETYECPDGGTYTVNADISSLEVPTVGDTLTYTYNDCSMLGLIQNGSMTLTFIELTSYDLTPPFSIGVDVFFSSYSINDGTNVTSSDGDMSMHLSEDLLGNAGMVLSGNSLTSSYSSVMETLTNYHYEMTLNNIGDFSLDMQGTIISTEIGGSVSFDTITTFTGNDYIYDANPTAGVLLITSTLDNSQERITALSDGVNVQIEVDADGDGFYETTIMTTWLELENS